MVSDTVIRVNITLRKIRRKNCAICSAHTKRFFSIGITRQQICFRVFPLIQVTLELSVGNEEKTTNRFTFICPPN